VKVHTIGANLGQQVHNIHWRDDAANRQAERVAARVAHRPQAKGEFVFGFRLEIRHESALISLSAQRRGALHADISANN
jgi:hypothetical protein